METGITPLTPELLAWLGSGGVNAILPFNREIFLLDVTVAGTTHTKNMDEIEKHLLPDTKLKMIRQPQNEFDNQAIGVYFENTRIGWVPMDYNEVISRLMDAGKAFFSRIESVTKKGKWLKIDVKIFMVE